MSQVNNAVEYELLLSRCHYYHEQRAYYLLIFILRCHNIAKTTNDKHDSTERTPYIAWQRGRAEDRSTRPSGTEPYCPRRQLPAFMGMINTAN